MRKRITLFFFSLFTLMMTASMAHAQAKNMDAESRLKELGIKLIKPSAPTASYVKAVRIGNLVFLSGHGPDKPEGGQVIGKLGKDLSIEQGQEAARLVGISLLSSLKAEIGDLNKVNRVVKVLGMVNAEPSFEKHSQVMNGFSDLMIQVFWRKWKTCPFFCRYEFFAC